MRKVEVFDLCDREFVGSGGGGLVMICDRDLWEGGGLAKGGRKVFKICVLQFLGSAPT